MRFYLIVILLFAINFVRSQEVLLEKDVTKSRSNNKSGILHKHFYYFSGDYSFYFIGNNNFPYIPFKSHAFSAGLRYQHRIKGNIMAGVGGSYHYNSYHIDQNKDKSFISPEKFDSEKIQLQKLYIDLYSRFILKKVYNELGGYFDAGFFGNLLMSSRHIMINSEDSVYQGKTTEIKIKGLKFIEPFNYGIYARLGYNHFALVGRYILNRPFKDYTPYQPPVFTIGIEVNIY
jgi:hypothetical protein